MELCCVTITDSFLDSVSDLHTNDVRRVGAFIAKLLAEASPMGLRPKPVHEAGDRTVRSYRVTNDLRAIARIEGQDVVLLYVGQHKRAYAWAARHCIQCEDPRHRIQLSDREGIEPERLLDGWECVDGDDLCRLFEARGLAHGLR